MSYCKHCEHCKLRNKSPFNGKFNYGCRNISDSDTVNPTVQHLEDILKRINKKITKIKNYYNGNIRIDLSDNYLRENGILELSKFLAGNKFLSAKITKLNLRHNRIKTKSFPYIRNILNTCPNVKIIIQVNRFNNEQVENEFKDVIQRIKYGVY